MSMKSATRFGFWVATAVLLVMALAPTEVHGGTVFNDKAQHLVGFGVLTALGLASWGKRSVLKLALALAALGALIELLQGTRLVGRDAEFSDWIADLAGIVAAVVTIRVVLFIQCERNAGRSDCINR